MLEIKTELQPRVSTRLSDLDPDMAIKIFYDYLIKSRVYTADPRAYIKKRIDTINNQLLDKNLEPIKKSELAQERRALDFQLKKVNERLDLHYILEKSIDDMYFSKSNKIPVNLILQGQIGYRFSKSIKVYEMKPEFLHRLESNGVKEIFLSRVFIKDIIDNKLSEYDQAIIKYFLFPKVDLFCLVPGLPKKDKKHIEKMNRHTRRYKLLKAIEGLIETIITIQEDL